MSSEVQSYRAGLRYTLLRTDNVEQFLDELAKLRALAADIVTNVSGEPPRPSTHFQEC